MERIYKHKQTGSIQVLSDFTVETLGDTNWEYIKDFDPNNEEPEVVQDKDFAENKEPIGQRVRDVEEPVKTKPAKDVSQAKAVSLKDLDE
jgi:hypothetical protein